GQLGEFGSTRSSVGVFDSGIPCYLPGMTIPIFKVDSFTSEPFRGNPAGVCLLEESRSDTWMQAIAAEMNVSETAFVWSESGRMVIRYFTPTVEVPLCGHATLASTHILWEENKVPQGNRIDLSAKGGEVSASQDGDWICMDFPVDPLEDGELPPDLRVALGVEPKVTKRSSYGLWFLQLHSESAIRSAEPDFSSLLRGGWDPVLITASSAGGGHDFVSRFFAPTMGINEDPVTGFAHTSLGPYWRTILNKEEVTGLQVSARSGVVRVRTRGDRVLTNYLPHDVIELSDNVFASLAVTQTQQKLLRSFFDHAGLPL
ncbi:PhzF family phenazine biosynthesis protein, partial [Myxococcota bacterium]